MWLSWYLKISETIKRLFRRQPPPMTEELAAPTEAERQRENGVDFGAQIEAERLSAAKETGQWPGYSGGIS